MLLIRLLLSLRAFVSFSECPVFYWLSSEEEQQASHVMNVCLQAHSKKAVVSQVRWLLFSIPMLSQSFFLDKSTRRVTGYFEISISVKSEMPWAVLWPDNTQQCHKKRESEAKTAASVGSGVRTVQQQINLLNIRSFEWVLSSLTVSHWLCNQTRELLPSVS